MEKVKNWNKGAIMGAGHAAQYVNQYINQLLQEHRGDDCELPAWFVLFLDHKLEPLGIVTSSGAFDPLMLKPCLLDGDVKRVVSLRVYPDESCAVTADDLCVAINTGLILAIAEAENVATCDLIDVLACTLEDLIDAGDTMRGLALLDVARANMVDLALHALTNPTQAMSTLGGVEYVH